MKYTEKIPTLALIAIVAIIAIVALQGNNNEDVSNCNEFEAAGSVGSATGFAGGQNAGSMSSKSCRKKTITVDQDIYDLCMESCNGDQSCEDVVSNEAYVGASVSRCSGCGDSSITSCNVIDGVIFHNTRVVIQSGSCNGYVGFLGNTVCRCAGNTA